MTSNTMDQINTQMINQQITQLEQQLESVNENIINIKSIKDAIIQIGNTKKDTEILSPVSNGIFIKTKLLDNDLFLVNTGDGTTVEKNQGEILKILDDQMIQMNDIELELVNNLNKLNIQLEKLN